ncbi:glutamyl-tRNA reductase [Proteinivorax tanatarense]|uniref:Glutamyl-tRNA reductase n=1 Tax=Proteinivorax tanatarense TaxID=1260629 RepID=A0AAU7VJG5_9FIRM
MRIVVFGVTFKTSNIAVRERVAFNKSQIEEAYAYFRKTNFIEESVIISTCNRSEVYAVVKNPETAKEWFRDFFERYFNLRKRELTGSYFIKKEREAVNHIFRVSCGLDSLVLGEDQILGQVKDAFVYALENKHSKKILNRLFNEAVSFAKGAKTKTEISQKPLSISTIAVQQMEQTLGNIQGEKILVIGFGQMSRVSIENLLDKKAAIVFICNRTGKSVRKFQENHKKTVYIPYEERYNVINEVAAVLTATAANSHVLKKSQFSKEVINKNVCIIDIALPRDVDPDIGKIAGVSLYHMEQLKKVVHSNRKYREKCKDKIEEEIENIVDKYQDWYRCLPIFPTIAALKDYTHKLAEKELQILFNRYSTEVDNEKELIESVAKRITNKMWKRPILHMKNAGQKGEGEQVAAVFNDIFGLNGEAKDEKILSCDAKYRREKMYSSGRGGSCIKEN